MKLHVRTKHLIELAVINQIRLVQSMESCHGDLSSLFNSETKRRKLIKDEVFGKRGWHVREKN